MKMRVTNVMNKNGVFILEEVSVCDIIISFFSFWQPYLIRIADFDSFTQIRMTALWTAKADWTPYIWETYNNYFYPAILRLN